MASRGVARVCSASAQSPRDRELSCTRGAGASQLSIQMLPSCPMLHSYNVISSSEWPPAPGKLICGSFGRSGKLALQSLEVHPDFANPFVEPHPMEDRLPEQFRTLEVDPYVMFQIELGSIPHAVSKRKPPSKKDFSFEINGETRDMIHLLERVLQILEWVIPGDSSGHSLFAFRSSVIDFNLHC